MLVFENQKLLYLLFIILALVAGYVILLFIDRKRFLKNIDAPLLARLHPPQGDASHQVRSLHDGLILFHPRGRQPTHTGQGDLRHPQRCGCAFLPRRVKEHGCTGCEAHPSGSL